MKWMLASDFQIPYQDDRAVDLWFQVMKWFQPDVVDYLGDVSDQFCFARFQEGTTTEFLNTIPDDTKMSEFLGYVQAEEKQTAELYAKTRKMLPRSELFSALGNHDIRVWTYAEKKLPDLVKYITPESLWGLDSLGIDYIYYDDVPKRRYGDIYVHHGISSLAESVSSVKSDVGNLGVSLIRGHSHRMGSYYKTFELRNETLRGYEIGHMCKVDAEGFKYSQIHNWQQGFAIAHIHGEQVHVQLIEIRPDYTCVVDGKHFAA
jgi:predicted phosphodiesterase